MQWVLAPATKSQLSLKPASYVLSGCSGTVRVCHSQLLHLSAARLRMNFALRRKYWVLHVDILDLVSQLALKPALLLGLICVK